MRDQDFIVGKKYQPNPTYDAVLCIGFKSNGMPVFEDKKNIYIRSTYGSNTWKEWREPREFYICNRIVFGSRSSLDEYLYSNPVVAKSVEVIHVREVLS